VVGEGRSPDPTQGRSGPRSEAIAAGSEGLPARWDRIAARWT
jgi:hypothetical protein